LWVVSLPLRAGSADRPDPVGLLEAQDVTREPDLVTARQPLGCADEMQQRRGAPGP
jgi:hypothetical protein